MRLALLALLVLSAPVFAQQPPPLVAPTDALSPAEEKKGFTVPAGFEVQLVASEPQIQKPMQLAFDAKGRMWVTTSYHYPFAAPQGKGTDKLFVLSDIDPATGKAGKVQVFADDLNIPIGVLPLPDCKSVIVSSTGEIRKYTDTNDDGKADKMEVLFSGFGYVDTHGMTNSFTLMPDGWVYACHGFRNDSKVKGKDGHEVVMNSGHTFRFRPDGSRIEVYTRGQVNPFGIAVDPWFNLYTADCHSKPITQLIPGAYYESFGKPHDGLGFAEHVTRHDHGSTGLCGLTWYDADQFPKQYQGCMFVGNVVTSRINFDKIEWRGATPVAKELPDFMTSKDLWFRPVDIKLGPDGALYISDFYNKIIGHYEVDLKHPGRDRDHGRLWRVVWKGEGAKPAKMAFTDLSKEHPEELVKILEHPNLSVRLTAANQFPLRQKGWDSAFPHQKGANDAAVKSAARVYAPWFMLVEQIGLMDEEDDYANFFPLLLLSGDDPAAIELAVGMARGLTTRKKWEKDAHKIATEMLRSATGLFKAEVKTLQHPAIQRALVEMVTFHPHADFVAPLVELLKKCPPDDTHLKHAARVALRNCLRDGNGWKEAEALSTDAAADALLAGVAVGAKSEPAAKFLAAYLGRHKDDPNLPAFAEHIGRAGTPAERKVVLALAMTLTDAPAKADEMHRGLELLRQLLRGVQAGGKQLRPVGGGRSAPGEELEKFEELARRDLPAQIKTPAVARALAEVYAALPNATAADDRPTAFSLTRLVHCGLIRNPAAGDEARGIAIDTLGRLNLPQTAATVATVFADPKASPALREKALVGLGSMTGPEARATVREALKDAPYRTTVAVGTALAGAPGGADFLLKVIQDGKAPARLLQEKAILERLRAAKLPNLDRQIGALTKGLPPLDQKIAELMKKRSVAYTSAKPDKELGLKIFTKHCGACHKIGEAGGKIAPQLDGVGNRGLERVLEDTLDPNRNVDQAFRARIITTKDERTITGLMLRVEGEVVVVADAEGKEVHIPTKEIDSNRETMLSPMPANFGDAIPEADFNHLLAYLLEQRAKEPPKK